MKKEKVKKVGVLLKEGNAGNYWVRIYVREKGYTCKVYQSSSENKIVREMTVDSFIFIGQSLVFCMGESYFAYIPDEKEERFVGKVYDENFYVFTGPVGKKHYFGFDVLNEFAPVFGEAEKIEKVLDEEGYLHLLVYEKPESLRIFVRQTEDIFWEEHSSKVWWSESCQESSYYFIRCEGDYLYAFFYDAAAERLLLLYQGKNLSRFDNVFVEKNDNSYIVYIYDGKELVVAEEGAAFRESNERICLDDKFWLVKEDSSYIIDPRTHFVSKAQEKTLENTEMQTESREQESCSNCISETELSEKKSFWRRLGLWLGWWK